jgi:Membrane-associated sensor domain
MTNNYPFDTAAHPKKRFHPWVPTFVGLAILTGLCIASLYSFLLFHSLAEFFSILVAFSVFVIAWNTRNSLDNNYLLFVGMAYLAVGFVDLVHVLAYKGMGVFQGNDGNVAIQLWIGARYFESISLLCGMALIDKRPNPTLLIVINMTIVATFLTVVFHWNIFPVCFVEGVGLTPFKKGSEYIISAILLLTAALFLNRRKAFDPDVFRFLLMSILTTIAAELAFTFYVSLYGFSNILGHFFKFVSFYFVYRAVVVTGLAKPYHLIFRKLKESEKRLQHESDILKKTLKEIKVLSGLLPICSYCKKIRDDGGYWSQLETYINKHSMADFSHSICPDCESDIFNDFNKGDLGK